MSFLYSIHRNGFAALFLISVILVLLSASLSGAAIANFTLIAIIDSHSLNPVTPSELLHLSGRHEDISEAGNSTQRQAILYMTSSNAFLALSALSGISVDDPRAVTGNHVSSSLMSFWRALSYSQRGESEKAKGVIKSDPQLIQYLARSGLSAMENGDLAIGTALLKDAATLSEPDSLQPKVYASLSKALNTYEGNSQDAILWAHKWIDSDPRNADAYIWTAALYLWNGLPESAYQTLKVGHSSNVEQHRSYPGQMGQIYQARDEWPIAIRYYRQAWELALNYPEERALAAWYLGNALANNGQIDEAQEYLQIALQSGTPAVQNQASQLLSKLRDYKPSQ